MEKIFYRNISSIYGAIFGIPLILTCIITLTIIGLINGYVEVFIPFFILLIALIPFTLIEFFHKIRVNNKGIVYTYKGKEVFNTSWDEITDIKKKAITWNGSLVIIKGNEQIRLQMTKKRYNAIMEICPNNAVKSSIQKLGFFPIP